MLIFRDLEICYIRILSVDWHYFHHSHICYIRILFVAFVSVMAKKDKNKKSDDSNQEEERPEEKKKLDSTVKDIKRKFGEGSILKLGEARRVDVDAIPTGSLSLDLALGVGGIPKGRIIEIYGPEASGKSTLAQHIVANAQKQGGEAAFIDAEHALDPQYARRIGVDIDELLVAQPDAAEQALDIVEKLVRSGTVDVIVIDSVAALTPKAEIEGKMDDQQIGLQARLMSKALRKLTGISSKSGTSVIFLNQIRMKVGVQFGNPETTPGGKALKFYSSVRIELRRRAQIKKDGEAIGNRIKAKVVKNKVAPPFRSTEFDIVYNEGISYMNDLINTAVKNDIIEKSGSWYNYGEETLGQGVDAVREFLEESKDVKEEIEGKVRKKVREVHEDEQEGSNNEDNKKEDDKKGSDKKKEDNEDED